MKRRTHGNETRSEPLSREDQARLDTFKEYAVNHPLLEEVDSHLSRVLREPAGCSLVPVYGPSGVGKTTMEQRLVQRLASRTGPTSPTQPSRSLGQTSSPGIAATYPFLMLEARVPDGGTFNRADYYRTALTTLGEQMFGQWRWLDIHEGQAWETKTRSRTSSRGASFNEAPELRHALEEALIRHGIQAIFIDEAQHFLKVSSGIRLRYIG